jgi:hypothetical protein
MWNLNAQNSFSYQTIHLLCETVYYKWVNHKWNLYSLTRSLNKTIVKDESYVKLRYTKQLLIQNDESYVKLCEIICKQLNYNWNQYNLTPNLTEIIVKNEIYVKSWCTKRILLANDAPTFWNRI